MLLQELKNPKHPRLDRLNNALSDLVLGHDEDPIDGDELEARLRDVAKKHRLNSKEVDALRDVCDGPIGGPFEKYPLTEEALDTKKAEDLWAENKDSVAEYQAATTYDVRKIKNSVPSKYEVFANMGTTRKPYGTFDAIGLKTALTPIRPNQTPDAEGFVTYVSNDKVEAYQHTGDAVKVMLGKVGARLNKGDYLVRSNDGNDFQYSIEPASSFEASMKKA